MKNQDLDAVEIAQKQRHLHLLTKVKNNQHLSQSELEELKKLEAKAKKPKRAKKKEDKAAIAEDQLVTGQKAAARYAQVTERSIRNWVKAGMPRTSDGKYIKSMLDFYRRNEGKQATEERRASLAADANYKSTRAKLLQMELAVKQGQLVPIDQIEKGRVARILAVKRALLGLGRKLAPQIAKLKDERKIAAIINEETKSIIESFAGR